MTDPVRDTLLRQLDTAWSLASYHLDGLTDADCLWRPAERGLHVQQDALGRWVADWPQSEGYHIGPPSIGWTTWHLILWWSMAWNHTWGDATMTRHDVGWPGGADATRLRINELHEQWRRALAASDDAELASPERVHWPFQNRSMADLFAWANIELTKNAAEIGYARFLKGVSA